MSAISSLRRSSDVDGSDPDDSHPNMPLPPLEAEQRLTTQSLEIASWEKASGGVTGAKKLTIRFPDDPRPMAVKWKRAWRGGDGWNNSPRREIAVYAVQKLFLDTRDYVVPPIVARGLEPEVCSAIYPNVSSNLKGLRCQYGTLAVWMLDCHKPERVFDAGRIARDPRYAYHFGNLNLLHYLTNHRDARSSNFLVPDDGANPQVFSIDNGISFDEWVFNFLVRNLNKLRIKSLPLHSVERLRRVGRTELERLGVLAELRADKHGNLRNVRPGSNLDPHKGNRVRSDVVQIGLNASEIAGVAQRLERLLERIDRGELATF